MAAGNSADVDVCDYVAYLAEAPGVRAIVLLFEGVRSGRRLVEAARLAEAAGRALIVCKAGNTEASAKAALSHTGTMVGSAEAYGAAFAATGAIQTDDLEAVLEIASLFSKAGRPRAGRGIGIMATSGGAGVVSADKAAQKGLPLPTSRRRRGPRWKPWCRISARSPTRRRQLNEPQEDSQCPVDHEHGRIVQMPDDPADPLLGRGRDPIEHREGCDRKAGFGGCLDRHPYQRRVSREAGQQQHGHMG